MSTKNVIRFCWNSITRMSGELGSSGEFHVEDSNGAEWQTTMTEDKIACRVEFTPLVCVNAPYSLSGRESFSICENIWRFVKAELEPADDRESEQETVD